MKIIFWGGRRERQACIYSDLPQLGGRNFKPPDLFVFKLIGYIIKIWEIGEKI